MHPKHTVNKNHKSSQQVHEEQLGMGLVYTSMSECLPITDKTLEPITNTENKTKNKTRNEKENV